jgi:hypothetical protein
VFPQLGPALSHRSRSVAFDRDRAMYICRAPLIAWRRRERQMTKRIRPAANATRRRRAEGRPDGPKPSARRDKAAAVRACSWCGGQVQRRRKTCSADCEAQVQAGVAQQFAAASSVRMKELHRNGHPARTAEANRKRSETRRRQVTEERAWERDHPGPHDEQHFRVEIAPKLAELSATRLAKATGLSTSFWARLQKVGQVPHPRWWQVIADLND